MAQYMGIHRKVGDINKEKLDEAQIYTATAHTKSGRDGASRSDRRRFLATLAAAGAFGLVLCAMTAVAQSARDTCKPAPVIPLTASEPPAKIVVNPPLAEPLASRGVVIIQYCTENLHIVRVFGPNALAVSPRVGHIHARVDDASWVWADASGLPIILQGLLPGPHKVLIELVDANHHTLDKGVVTFVIPEKTAAEKDH